MSHGSWRTYGPVPVESAVVVSVEEVDLARRGAHVRVNPEILEQRARSALLHSDDDCPRQAPGGRGTTPVLDGRR